MLCKIRDASPRSCLLSSVHMRSAAQGVVCRLRAALLLKIEDWGSWCSSQPAPSCGCWESRSADLAAFMIEEGQVWPVGQADD